MKYARDNISVNKMQRISCFVNSTLYKHVIKARGNVN